jgi:AraC-like DNA-binding protein
MTIVPRTGQTRAGLPISVNVAPPPDLADVIARFFVTIIDQPDDQVTSDFLLNETALVRVTVRGAWEVLVGSRWVPHDPAAYMFGAQRKALHVRCCGPMAVAGFAIRPSGWFGIESTAANLFADRLTRLIGAWGAELIHACRDIDNHQATVARLIVATRNRAATVRGTVNPVMAAFERRAWLEPTSSVTAAAAEAGMNQSRFDRMVRAHFGHLPKTVMRRSRFLDMAAVMQGMEIPGLDCDASSRFYDASHLNREFRLFVDMTPARFARTSTPLLTPGLEVRQRRKLDYLQTLAPGSSPPWLNPQGRINRNQRSGSFM